MLRETGLADNCLRLVVASAVFVGSGLVARGGMAWVVENDEEAAVAVCSSLLGLGGWGEGMVMSV